MKLITYEFKPEEGEVEKGMVIKDELIDFIREIKAIPGKWVILNVTKITREEAIEIAGPLPEDK